MSNDLLPGPDHDLFDTDVRPFELLRLIEELVSTLDGDPASSPIA
jgi:hypothetical protein